MTAPPRALFFVNAQQVADRIQELVAAHNPHILLLDMSRVFDIEYSALQMLIEGERRMAAQGITLWLAGLNPTVLEYVRASALADQLGSDRLFFNAQSALRNHLANSEAGGDWRSAAAGEHPTDSD